MGTVATSTPITHIFSKNEPSLVSTNPATGEVIGTIPVFSAEKVYKESLKAREAQKDWALLSPKTRAKFIIRFQKILIEKADEIADLIVKENGKTKNEAFIMEIAPVIDMAGYFASLAVKTLKRQTINFHFLASALKKGYVYFQPRGIIGIISPWNFPFSLTASETLCALLAGNAVLIKPSEHTSQIIMKLKEYLDSAGIPKDLVRVVTGLGETGSAVIDFSDQIFFTGSVKVGKLVAQACAKRLIPCKLELGGKAPAIVCHDAPLERTAKALVYGAFSNAGQVCLSVERAYVHTNVYDTLLTKVVEYTKKLRQGDPQSFDTDVGAITFPPQMKHYQELVEDAVSKGAKVLCGGSALSGSGNFFSPTILVDVNHDMRVMKEEIFGPILPIMKVNNEQSALSLANESHLGLNAYIFSSDLNRANELAQKIEAGGIMINDVIANYAHLEAPFGGIKESGLGRTHGEDAITQFCHTKYVQTERVSSFSKELWWYPYSEKLYRLMKFSTRFLFAKDIKSKLNIS